MYRESLIIDAAIAIAKAKEKRLVPCEATWKEINEQFHMRTSDRRFKVWFCSCTDKLRGFWRVGSYKFLLEFMNGNIYVRPVNDCDKYEEKPCYEIIPLDNGGYKFEWQRRVMI